MADESGVTITYLPAPGSDKPKEPLYATAPPVLPDTEKERSDMLGLFGFVEGDVPLPPVAGSPPTPAGDPASTGAPATDPAAPAAPAEPPKRPPNRLPSPSDIAKEAADRALREAGVTAPAAPAPDTGPPEDPALNRRLEALEILQRENPDYANRNLKSEYEAYLTSLDEYKKSWESKNPGEPFNLEDSQHEQWREAKQPDIEEDDIREAELEVKITRKLDAREQGKQMRQFHETVVHRAAEDSQRTANEILSFADGKEYKTLEELDKADWAAAMIARTLIPEATSLTVAATSLLTPGTPVQYDPNRPDHQEIARQVRHYETEIQKLPPEQRLDGYGRQYVPADQYMRLTAREQAKTWTFRFSPDIMRGLIANEFKSIAKTKLEEVRARGGGAPASAPSTPPNPPPPRPPSGGAGTTVAPSASRPPAATNESFWTS